MMDQHASPAARSGVFKIAGDLPVHRLGYGTMRLVGDGAWGEPAEPAQCHRVLRRAVELGVNLIDTADAYGPEIAERLIAEALHPYADSLVIATKGGITRLGALRRMQEQGKIRHVGLSEVTPDQIEDARKIVEVVTVQNRYSLGDRRNQETLKYCEAQSIGFLPWYPMAGGKQLKSDHPSASILALIAARHSAGQPVLATIPAQRQRAAARRG